MTTPLVVACEYMEVGLVIHWDQLVAAIREVDDDGGVTHRDHKKLIGVARVKLDP